MFSQVLTEMLVLLKSLNGKELVDSKKSSKKKRKRDHLLLEDDDTLIWRSELVFISTFLMTQIGLESVCMVNFDASWVVIIDVVGLTRKLSKLMKKGDLLAHYERKRKSHKGNTLRTFSVSSVVDILKRHINALGIYNFKTTIENRWPGIKCQDVMIFSGSAWLERWRELMRTNEQEVKRWRSELSTWKMETVEMSEYEKKGWLTCHKFIPHGLFHEEEEMEDIVPFTTPFKVEFGWCVSLQGEEED
jgi:hypothetical protein